MRRAFRRGLLRAALVVGAMCVVVTVLAYAVAAVYDGPILYALEVVAVLAAFYYGFFIFDPGLRTAREVLQWMTQRHVDRWANISGERSLPPTPVLISRLEALAGVVPPALERIRARELASFLIDAGRTGKARALVDRTDAIDPFFRAAVVAGATLRETGDASLAEPAAALASVAPDDRVEAEVTLAMLQAMRAAAAGGDWRAPFVDVRPRLGARIAPAYLKALRRRRLLRLVVALAIVALVFIASIAALPIRQ